jgi:hypothetical protein
MRAAAPTETTLPNEALWHDAATGMGQANYCGLPVDQFGLFGTW